MNKEEEKLKILGTTLYWGEGYKTNTAFGVDFANSDSEMIRIFMNFLRKICGINESKLRIQLYCYSNQHPTKLVSFWSKITKIPRKKFIKPYVRKDFKESQIGKMKNGLIHVRYHDKKLLIQLRDLIGCTMLI